MLFKFPLAAPILPWKQPFQPEALHALWELLLDESDSEAGRFLSFSDAARLDGLLPQWQRIHGPCNIQHKNHDFALDVHTAYVIAKTRRSPYYQALSAVEKKEVMVAALLHDIAKDTGCESERQTITPDFYHPVKGVPVVRKVLPNWGFSLAAVERICRLVHHHQLFGRMIIRYGKPELWPEENYFHEAASKLQTRQILNMLLPLTEGDICSVRAHDAIFTPLVAQKLQDYSRVLATKLTQLETALPKVGNSDAKALFQSWDATPKHLDEALSRAVNWPVYSLEEPSQGELPYVLQAELKTLQQWYPCACNFWQQEAAEPALTLLNAASVKQKKLFVWVDALPEFQLGLYAFPGQVSLSEAEACLTAHGITLSYLQHQFLETAQHSEASVAEGGYYTKQALYWLEQCSKQELRLLNPIEALATTGNNEKPIALTANPLLSAIIVPSKKVLLADSVLMQQAKRFNLPVAYTLC